MSKKPYTLELCRQLVVEQPLASRRPKDEHSKLELVPGQESKELRSEWSDWYRHTASPAADDTCSLRLPAVGISDAKPDRVAAARTDAD